MSLLGYAKITQQAKSPSSTAVLELARYHNDNPNLTFSYPKQVVLDTTKGQGRVVKLSNPSNSPAFSVTIDSEQGLRLPANSVRKSTLDFILDNTTKVLPRSYLHYQETSRKKLQLAGHDAAEIYFNYSSQNKPISARFILIMLSDDSALYIRAQSEAESFANNNETYFNPIVNSLQL